MPRLLACIVSSFALLASCYGARDHVRALDALHEADGSIRFVAPIETPQAAFWRDMMRALPMDIQVAEPTPVRVGDPYELTLEHLIELTQEDVDDPESRALILSACSWYGVHDPFSLARERSFRGIGRAGEVIGIERLEPEPETAATPDEIVGDVRAIVSAIGAARREELGWSDGLATACASLDERPLDLEGGYHTARVLARLIDLTGERESPGWEPFHATLDGVLRRLAAQALGLGLGDSEPLVRAAVLRASLRASDGFGQVLAELLQRDRSEAVRVEGLSWLAQNGFPRGETFHQESSSRERAAFEADWVQLVISLLQESFEGPVAVQACRALDTLTDAPLRTLRTEEWLAWYYDQGGRESIERDSNTP